MPVRNASAVWQGDLTGGKGSMKLGSGAFEGGYSFGTRFEEVPGTNPEELIGAAHAGCFSMALAGALARAGFPPERISTSAKVHIDKVETGFRITKIELVTEAHVPDIDNLTFQDTANATKSACPVSQALAAVPEITLDAKLV
ncbi:MAG TPA: OsmC family peroxiredoxin [Aggregatilinea sp.]|jgi:osmotically inducible protein OsmC|uniref:OsmC family peroxiredoxin n=1 Tax=Aggregatilinea sp. TaxID=2806333 RepID=UPI002CB16E16|nr:OsmC family peroxiredoxin [Aggregatilinea sp.]HML23853.1 OsmC family peroxiredoxin [Aggregatilinea sp.]